MVSFQDGVPAVAPSLTTRRPCSGALPHDAASRRLGLDVCFGRNASPVFRDLSVMEGCADETHFCSDHVFLHLVGDVFAGRAHSAMFLLVFELVSLC